MTQEQANKIFDTDLGQQLDVIYVTSDDKPFIRLEEAQKHVMGIIFPFKELEDKTITEFYPKY